MSLGSLTTSGWVLFVWTCLVAVAFLRNMLLMVSLKSDAARIIVAKTLSGAAILLIVQLLWLRWLVT